MERKEAFASAQGISSKVADDCDFPLRPLYNEVHEPCLYPLLSPCNMAIIWNSICHLMRGLKSSFMFPFFLSLLQPSYVLGLQRANLDFLTCAPHPVLPVLSFSTRVKQPQVSNIFLGGLSCSGRSSLFHWGFLLIWFNAAACLAYGCLFVCCLWARYGRFHPWFCSHSALIQNQPNV